MKFFSADLHLGHKRIIDYCNRPFRTLDGQMDADAMDEQFIKNFNTMLRPGDELYILGDLSFDVNRALGFCRRVVGQKFMVWGNHDPKRKDRKKLEKEFVRTGDILETGLSDGTKIVMCHYPMLRWNKGHFGSWMLHGHTHGGCSYPYPMRIMDVGVDKEFPMPGNLWHTKYFPVSEKELGTYMREIAELKHHPSGSATSSGPMVTRFVG